MTSYAIIKSGGKQYKVSAGDLIDVELIKLEDNQKEVVFDQVLCLHDGEKCSFGQPFVAGATVTASFVNLVKGEKVIAYKYKKRKNYRRKIGHRQHYVRVQIASMAIN